MTYRIPLSFDSFDEQERDAVLEVLDGKRYTEGERVARFEDEFARFVGTRHAVMVNSGSSANLVAVTALGYAASWGDEHVLANLAPGDEVIVQALCWPTTLTPLQNLGLTPVFCDIEPDTLNASPQTVDHVRTKRTRMVIAVPVLGNPAGVAELADYCREEDLILLEDACESLGAVGPGGRQIGNFGVASSFSFYFSHHISTIEGGCIATDSPVLAALCRTLRDHGWVRALGDTRLPEHLPSFTEADDRYCFALPGYNVRPQEIMAALGSVQLAKLPGFLKKRRQMADHRVALLEPYGEKVTVPGARQRWDHSWMAFPVLFDSPDLKNAVQGYLEEQGVETRLVLVGNILRHPIAAYLDTTTKAETLDVCDRVLHHGLMLGLSPSMSESDEDYLCRSLLAGIEKFL